VRVKDTTPVERVGKVGLRDVTSTEASRDAGAARTDKVSIDKSLEQESIAAEVRRQVGTVRQEHLAEIEAAVKSGTYRPSARAISERIIAAAALDAQLAVLARGGR
jgi:anti-sigma28 factor (negative regulator of flagellin synthesis)